MAIAVLHDVAIMPLEREIAAYRAHLAAFRDHEGQYVLIHGDDVIDFFAAYEDAINAGYQRFGLESFLVKLIHANEQAQVVSLQVCPNLVGCSI